VFAPTRVHEDTLKAITSVCDWLEEHQFEELNRWDGDRGAYSCLACGKVLEDINNTPHDERHEPTCELVAKIEALRTFVRVEYELIDKDACGEG
jgi:hypothetical protein